jgi:YD repeat-containing protein
LTYDAGLNLVSVVDANGNTTRYSYTPRNTVETEFYADGTTVSYAYDPRGSVASLILQDNQIITQTYDALGRLTGKAFSTGGSQTLTYDVMGRMATADQSLDGYTTALTCAYNAVGDVVSTTQALDGTGWQVDYGYDYVNAVYTVTYPSGAQRVQAMDALNRLDTVQRGDGIQVADYDYYDADFYHTLTYSNGLTTRVDYDTLGRTTQISSSVADYRYGYDAVGNRTYLQRYHQSGQPADVYQYDALYQLTLAWYGADSTDPGSITSYDLFQWYDLDDGDLGRMATGWRCRTTGPARSTSPTTGSS